MFRRALQSIVLAASVTAGIYTGGCAQTHDPYTLADPSSPFDDGEAAVRPQMSTEYSDAGLVDLLDADRMPDGSVADCGFDSGFPDAGLLDAGVSDAGSPVPLIFMVEGQSNASGRGLIYELPTWEPDTGITMFTNAWTWRVASEPLDDPTDTVDSTMYDTAGVGPGLAFARRLRESLPDTPIVLVPCSKGGSLISEWQRSFLAGQFYAVCLRRALYVQVQTRGLLAGVIWYQGESDARRLETSDAFYGLTTTMIRDFRMDVGVSDLPVLLVRLHPTNPNATVFPYWSQVRDSQRAMDVEPGVTVVEADGELNPDRIHLATSAQLALGTRLADQYVSEFLHR